MTAAEMARIGGAARAKAHSKAQLSEMRQEGRPAGEVGPEGARNAEKAAGNSTTQAECAAISGRVRPHHRQAVARMRP